MNLNLCRCFSAKSILCRSFGHEPRHEFDFPKADLRFCRGTPIFVDVPASNFDKNSISAELTCGFAGEGDLVRMFFSEIESVWRFLDPGDGAWTQRTVPGFKERCLVLNLGTRLIFEKVPSSERSHQTKGSIKWKAPSSSLSSVICGFLVPVFADECVFRGGRRTVSCPFSARGGKRRENGRVLRDFCLLSWGNAMATYPLPGVGRPARAACPAMCEGRACDKRAACGGGVFRLKLPSPFLLRARLHFPKPFCPEEVTT